MIWRLIEGPLIDFGLAAILAYAALSILGEYRRLFEQDKKSIMSAEILMLAITSSGGPGYFAAFLLTASALCVATGAVSLLLNISSYLGLLDQ